MITKILTGIAVILIIAVVILFVDRFGSNRDDEWKKKIDQYAVSADSLRKVMARLDREVYTRDSLLAIYISTLNQSLVELDKEQQKNRTLLNENETRQAETLEAYCAGMPDSHKPAFCAQPNSNNANPNVDGNTP